MRKIELDLKKMDSVPALHKHLFKMLNLPKYYGCNLDALHDCLTEMAEPVEIVVPKAVAEEKYLGNYGEGLLNVFQDSAEENECLKITIK